MERKRFGIETYVLALREAKGNEYKADELVESVYDKTTDFIWVIMEDDEIVYFYHTTDSYPNHHTTDSYPDIKYITDEPTWLTQAIHDEVSEMLEDNDFVYIDSWREETGYPMPLGGVGV